MNERRYNHAGDFDLLSTPIEGTTLIEAGAGTGKTYTLTAVLLRLIVEQGLAIDRILVVTFTEAATAELKGKIRTALRAACREIEGTASGDPFLASLTARLPDRDLALARLREAVVSFDLAAVCTIHGFCSRLLQDNAFESGSRFEMEIEGEQTDVLRRVVDDFWRSRIYRESPLFISYLLARSFTPDFIASMLEKVPRGPFVRLTPSVEMPDTSEAEERFKASFARLKQAWRESENDVALLLEQDPCLKRNVYQPSSMPGLVREMGGCLEREEPCITLFKGFDKFTASKIRSSCRKGTQHPFHPFFELCQIHQEEHMELEEVFAEKLTALKSLAFSFADTALGRHKAETNRVSFDDLLLDVHNSLNGPGGERFARTVRQAFGAVLIDEFQDTDAVQWSIFKRIFHGRGVKLLLIGDPKQAIYGFRGADIYAYMRAAREADTRYTLRTNWRSEPRLLSAVNSLFTRAARPFVLENIPYLPSAPAPSKQAPHTEPASSPFTLWFLRPNDRQAAVTRGKARALIAGAVAGEIARLLEAGRTGHARLGDSPLAERHMAVLVRTNTEAALIQEALRNLDIPSVRHQTGNIFETREALEIRRILSAITEPRNSGLLRAALSTDMLGRRGEDLLMLERDAGGIEEEIENFHRYHGLWHERGFIRMMRLVLSEHGAVPRLMTLPGGERRVTNLFHLSELLQQASSARRIPESLIKWLTDRIEAGRPEQDEHLLRLEGDRDAVTLVTIHKSKGLEYPVVFCPFCWGESTVRKGEPALVFHDPHRDFELVADIAEQWSHDHLALAQEENLAENLRLLYVALTRARAVCYLVWGKINDTETSAPAWLFHRPDPPPETGTVSALAGRCRPLSPEVLEEEVNEAVAAAAGNIAVSPLPDCRPGPVRSMEKPPEELECRTFTRRIDNEWGIASFSSIAHGARSAPEAPDHDEGGAGASGIEEPEPAQEPVPFSDMFSFPRGAGAGAFLHGLLEHTDFTAVHETKTADLVHSECIRFGFDPRWTGAIIEMLRNLAATPLDPSLTLSEVGARDRINELEFLFPLARITPHVLDSLFHGSGGSGPGTMSETIGRLQFSPIKGFMKGFMDMVFHRKGRFYLVDWKSNFLGEHIEDYRRDALDRAMDAGRYRVQYHIYALALDRYLRLRVRTYRYREHFGGIFYVFLRGINRAGDPRYGIFRDKPTEETMAALRSCLLDGDRGEGADL